MSGLLTCSVCGDSGDVRGESGVKIVSVKRLGLASVCERCGHAALIDNPLTKAEAARLRKNRNRRERDQAMRDTGMVKTPYGWE